MLKVIINIGYNSNIIAKNFRDDLHPKSQRNYLLALIEEFKNEKFLQINSNSVYIIQFITLFIKAQELNLKNDNYPNTLIDFEIREYKDIISNKYQVLNKYKTYPSDENILNDFIYSLNSEFSELLDIEDKQMSSNK